MKRPLSLPACLLVSTATAFAQLPLDVNGTHPGGVAFASHTFAKTVSTSFTFVDTLQFPIMYTPGPGQFSKDGLEYYVGLSTRPGTSFLYVLRRLAVGQPFGAPLLLSGSLNDASSLNIQPSITSDRKTMIFVRSHMYWSEDDLYIATRSDTSLPFDSVRALAEINSPDTADAYPWISPDGLRLYFTKGVNQANEIFLSTRQSPVAPFGTPHPLTMAFAGVNTFSGWLSNDERELYFTSGASSDSVMYALRPQPADAFPVPEFVPSLSTYGFVAAISVAGDEL